MQFKLGNIFLILFLLTNLNSSSQAIIYLDTNWQYKMYPEDKWENCKIPNYIHTILANSNIIADPYYSNNEDSLQEIGKKEIEFRSEFNIESFEISKAHRELVLHGIDTYADIYVNNIFVGSCNNAFRTWRFTLNNEIKLGKNELKIIIQSTDKLSKLEYSKLPYALPGGERVVCRKPQYQFGWDFGPKFISSGILQSPYIEFYDEINVLESTIHTLSLHKSFATVELNLSLNSTKSQKITIQCVLDHQIFVKTISLAEGNNFFKIPFKIKNPILWWPNGSGEAYLYDTRIQINNDKNEILIVKHQSTGIRTIQLIHKNDQWGKSFYFNVNGVNVFAKGANYIPQDIFQMPDQDVDKILTDAHDCHFNILRVWGGGNYESNGFYEKCDKLGIMIWQDFMYACAMYPGHQEFLDNISIEAKEQVQRLSKFACIALWCGNNENNEAWNRWGWQIGLANDTKQRLWSDYQKVFNTILPNMVEEYSNQNSYWESSPLFGRGDKKFQTEGDAHDWGVWHDEMKFEAFEQRVPRFMSEMGFQSLPALNTILKFCPENELNLESKSMLSHQKHPRGNKLILDYLQRDLPDAKNFKSLIYLNQLNQAEGIGLAISAHRIAKPYCMGTLYWQYNDCWPGISWSSRDYFGQWKALQHKTKQLYQDVIIAVRRSGNMLEIFASSDLNKPIKLNLKIQFTKLTLEPILEDSMEVKLQSNQSKRIYTIQLDEQKIKIDETNAALNLMWNYNNNNSSQVYFLTKLKKIKLLKPLFKLTDLETNPQGFQFNLSTDQVCKGIHFEENDDMHFFPNFIDLFPQQSIKVICKTNLKKINLEEMKIESLYDYLIPIEK